MRFIIDSIFVFFFIDNAGNSETDSKVCDINKTKSNHVYLRIVNVILEATVTHFLPIFMILRIFNVELK